MASNSTKIGELSTSQKLDDTNYEIWHRKIQYPLDDKDLLEHLTVTKVLPFDKDRDGKPIDSTVVQYQESAKAYQDWSNKDHATCYTMLYCMHDDLIGEFEECPIAKDMWDQLRVRFGQTLVTTFRTLHLKWMQYEMDSTYTIVEHLRTMSAMVHDLKAAGQEIMKRSMS